MYMPMYTPTYLLFLWATLPLTSTFSTASINVRPIHTETCSSGVLSSTTQLRTCPLPVDNKKRSEYGDWSPWSHRPYCVKPVNKPDNSPKYCAFTSETFRGDGISLITSPELAASIADATVDESDVPPKLRNHPSSSLSLEPGVDLPYEIEEIPGKGKGAVAVRPISRLETVMVDYPALIVQLDFFESVSSEQGGKLLEKAMSQLRWEQQAAVLLLATSDRGGLVQDIINTNSFGIEIDGVTHLALFVEGSLEADNEEDVPLGNTHKERTDVLNYWGFNCTCSVCSASVDEIALSDTRRQRLREIYGTLNEGTNLDEDKIEDLLDEITYLVDEEGLQMQMVLYYGAIARGYMHVTDFESAKRYIDLAEATWIRYGAEEEGAEDIRMFRQEWERALESHEYLSS